MRRTTHDQHQVSMAWCMACRWLRMTPDEQAAHRELQRARSRARWRASHPEQAAIRDRVLAGQEKRPCGCGATDTTAYITDYAAGTFLWRCRPCAKAARTAWTVTAGSRAA